MSLPTDPEEPKPTRESISKSTSELNNLLQIISGTSTLIENVWEGSDGSEKYLAMLRSSIERAEKVAADLVEQAGGTDKKMAMHPDLAGFVKTAKKPAETDAGPLKQSILLVDDEQMALTLVKRVLTEAGYHVVTAQSGFECLDHFRKRPWGFDLVLLDLTMPFMDGEETFSRLRDIRPDVPVVLCTGFIQQDRLTRLMTAGLAGFLRKPISPNEIISLVRNTLESVKYSRGNLTPGGITAVV
jgi:CheY-like chemotaxis protein